MIHSWWVPQLGGKMDAIPGKVNHTWFEAPHEGIYQGQCAEFCGIEHAMMLTQVRAVSNSEYESWAARQLRVSANIGQMTFAGACAPCHGMQGQGIIGPPLKGNRPWPTQSSWPRCSRTGRARCRRSARTGPRHELASLVTYLRKEFASGG